jgi:IS605 OrfB family transposase
VSTVIQAFRFALDPAPEQDAALRSHCGGQRFAFNWGLARVKANLDQRAAEKSYDLPDERLTPSLSWSAYSLRKNWNQAKGEAAPWWVENSKEACASGLANLATALTNWNDSRGGRRRGPKVRFPRFKGRRAGLSCRFTTGAFGLAVDRRHVTLPRIGVVRTHARRTGPDKRTGREPSNRWHTTRARIARLHTAVANARRDGLHKLSTRLVRTHGTIVLEDLNVTGMTRNRCLARHVAGVGMAELRRQIGYKATWAGGRLHVADRWYPSSRTCSACGTVKAKLRLSERTFTCQACGFTLDRDLNAARNLAALVTTSSPSRGATLNEPDGNPRQTHTVWAAGTATGRPARTPGRPTPRRKATAQNTSRHVF